MDKQELNLLTDEELILEFQKSNDQKVFEILVERFKDPLINFVYRFLGDYEACVDVVQDTFVKVYRYKDSYTSVAKFSTWIYTIAGNLARSEYRKRKRNSIFSINDYGEEGENFDIPDNKFRPDVEIDRKFKAQKIQEALMKLKEVYREAVILRDIQGLTYEEIAEILKIEEGTVKSRINRGRAQLQKYLKNIYKD